MSFKNMKPNLFLKLLCLLSLKTFYMKIYLTYNKLCKF